MEIYRHQIIVNVLTTDKNPASVAQSVENHCDGMEYAKTGALVAQALPAANVPVKFTVKEAPSDPKEYDKWFDEMLEYI